MRATLNELVQRMTLREDDKSSAESTSWRAYREAERLVDTSLIGELEQFIALTASKEERKAAYFILGSIGENTADMRCTQILIQRVAIESDKYVLSVLLGGISKLTKPEEISLAPIFSLLHDRRWIVRHSAIEALKHSISVSAEDMVLAVLATTTDAYDKVYCHATLGKIGTSQSIPLLAQSLTARKKDVKFSAEAAIAAIKTRSDAAASLASI